jgi:hypothetical protein
MIIAKKSNTLEGVEKEMKEQLKIIYNLKGFSVKGIQIKQKDNEWLLRIDIDF